MTDVKEAILDNTDKASLPGSNETVDNLPGRLKMARRVAKSALTRASNELRELMAKKEVVLPIQEKLQACSQKFATFSQRHSDFHEQLTETSVVNESDAYFRKALGDYHDLRETVQLYVQEYEQQLQDAVKSRDSVSNVTSKGSRSSVRSALVKAHAKRAALKAEAEALQEMQKLEREIIDLEQRHKQLHLEAQIKMAEAEEMVYKEELIENASMHSRLSIKVDEVSPRSEVLKPSQIDKGMNPLAAAWVPTPPEKFNSSICDLLRQGQQQQQMLVDVMQLPKTELPTFDGDPLKYWQFIRSFENSVDRVNADSNAKLMRLVQYCSGKALQVVECCLVMSPDAGYARAREMLAERFGNSYVISQAWIQCVSQGEALRTNDVRALQEFADTMRACKETLQAMDML